MNAQDPGSPRCAAALACAILLVAGGCGGQERGTAVPARIQVERASTLRWSAEEHGVRVETRLDGSLAGWMALDTGRRRSLVTPAVVAALSLPVTRRGDADAPAEVVTRLGFANVNVLDWRPAVGVVDDPGLVGILGQDVLARLELVLDRQVEELRILPAGGVARELAAFAAEGWLVRALPLVVRDGRLVLEARPVAGAASQMLPTADPTAVQPLVVEEPPPPSAVGVSTFARETRLPDALVRAASEGAAQAVRVDGQVLPLESLARSSRDGLAVLGADFLERFLVGWDGPGRTLFLAERPAVARRF